MFTNPTPPYVKTSDTSLQAANAYRDSGKRTSHTRRIFDFLANAPFGATRDEIIRALNMRHQTVTPRVLELISTGTVNETAETRQTTAGQQATVCKLAPGATFESHQQKFTARKKALDERKIKLQRQQYRDERLVTLATSFSRAAKRGDIHQVKVAGALLLEYAKDNFHDDNA